MAAAFVPCSAALVGLPVELHGFIFAYLDAVSQSRYRRCCRRIRYAFTVAVLNQQFVGIAGSFQLCDDKFRDDSTFWFPLFPEEDLSEMVSSRF